MKGCNRSIHEKQTFKHITAQDLLSRKLSLHTAFWLMTSLGSFVNDLTHIDS